MTDITEILDEKDDETLLMQVIEAITNREDFDISQIPQAHRNVVAAVTAQAIIDNGGFRYFFESNFNGHPDYQMFVDAYNNIGAKEAADAINQALMLFPNGSPPAELDEREKYLDALFGEGAPSGTEMGDIETKISGKVEHYAMAANYVRENKDQFV